MTDKSFVSIATEYCPICDKEFQTQNLLMDTRIVNGKLAETFERTTCVGVALCSEHQAMVDSGEYIVFFVCAVRDCGKCNYRNSVRGHGRCLDSIRRSCDRRHYSIPGSKNYVYRTGQGFMIHRKAAASMFSGVELQAVNHCDKELYDKMLSLVQKGEKE